MELSLGISQKQDPSLHIVIHLQLSTHQHHFVLEVILAIVLFEPTMAYPEATILQPEWATEST